MEKVSVIVPAYKSEKTIERCVNSILKQTYFNLEVLVICQKPLDKTIDITNDISSKDTRLVSILTPEGSGVSHNRNVGIKASTGTLLLFVDSDDYFFSDNAIASLLKEWEPGTIVAGNIFCCKNDIPFEEKNRIFNILDTTSFDNFNDAYDSKYSFPLFNVLMAKVFEKRLIEKKQIHFDEHIDIGEDSIFVYQYLKECNKVCLVNKNIYVYTFDNDSSLSSTLNIDNDIRYYKYYRKASSIFNDNHLMLLWLTQFWRIKDFLTINANVIFKEIGLKGLYDKVVFFYNNMYKNVSKEYKKNLNSKAKILLKKPLLWIYTLALLF